MQEVCAQRRCKLNLGNVQLLEDDESLLHLEAKFDRSDAHGYLKGLESLLINPKAFMRAEAEIYITNFSNELIQDPSIEDPLSGGAH